MRPRPTPFHAMRVSLLLVLATHALAACGGAPQPTLAPGLTPRPTNPSAGQPSQLASADALKSYRSITRVRLQSSDGADLYVSEWTEEWTQSPSARHSTWADGSGRVSMEIITIEGVTWAKLGGDWIQSDSAQAPATNVPASVAPRNTADLKPAGSETVNGVRCKKYTYDSESPVTNPQTGQAVKVRARGEMWVADQPGLPTVAIRERSQVEGGVFAFAAPAGGTPGAPNVARTLVEHDVSDVNTPITIKPPDSATVMPGTATRPPSPVATPPGGQPSAVPATMPPAAPPTAAPTATRRPPVAPSAALIAFESDRTGDLEIFVMNVDGSGVRNLTNNPAHDVAPTWSPDGARIAFVSDREGGIRLYVMSADDGGVTQLPGDPDDSLRGLDWSPSGRQLAFVSDRDGNPEIYVLDIDSGEVARLSENDLAEGAPSWSPDGARIAFQWEREGMGSDIYVMSADGSEMSRLTDTASDYEPAWSPDGQRIALVSARDGPMELYVMNADGSSPKQLTDNESDEWSPSWSPDGARIVFGSTRDGNYEIYAINIDGSGEVRLTDDPADDRHPRWQPR